ncbi:MAG: hypothetical protein EXX96DRAFT_563360 [Benjaminiella poitrasii]|nr:MAG: hypothetical protein EXX96DRAFT_563360 [Benjaminiella poitrasii]
MISPDVNFLSSEQANKLLERLSDWKNGICPNGKLAKQSCFVLKQRPHIYFHPEQPSLLAHKQPQQQQQQNIITTEIITEWPWAENLVDTGAIVNLNDDMMIKTMSDFFMIFHHANDSINSSNTLHLLQLYKHASFNTDNIHRPTRALQQKLHQVLQETDPAAQWEQLNEMWDMFGYLWPRKIIIGYRTYTKQTYPFADPSDCTYKYYFNSSMLNDQLDRQFSKKSPFFDINNFLNDCDIISRLDVAPLHEFFDEQARTTINSIINTKFSRIPTHYPVKFYNMSTHSYLCWDPSLQQDPVFGGSQDYLVRSISAEHSEISKSSECQYLWQLTWTPTTLDSQKVREEDTTDFLPAADHRDETIRGFSRLCIYPACKSISPLKSKHKPQLEKNNQQYGDDDYQNWTIQDRMRNESDFIETNKWMLICPHRQYEIISSRQEISKLKGLRLIPTESLNFNEDQQLDWTVEYPYNSLKYMTDAQPNIKLNFHEYVRRIKPVLNGDVIQLQQVGLLTAFNPNNIKSTMHDVAQQKNNGISKETSHRRDLIRQRLKMAKENAVHRVSFRSRNKKIVLCVDEDITRGFGTDKTFWRIELPNEFDKIKHSSNLCRLPITTIDQQNMLFEG